MPLEDLLCNLPLEFFSLPFAGVYLPQPFLAARLTEHIINGYKAILQSPRLNQKEDDD